ncbi:hypothetical protein JAAARDRAFT_122743 [Jaapia argillacea MUCL 33604]|uniref:RhoGAP-domain-containing protein n=1 Tax=Jaapia argillacea MUCL 33604 TaxID=933084 RepID=A0A067Q6G7_9AGAM|nr:hypothetical protein JAAARDRAFT_122743 [Jaapia argillacea MUCL 33604]
MNDLPPPGPHQQYQRASPQSSANQLGSSLSVQLASDPDSYDHSISPRFNSSSKSQPGPYSAPASNPSSRIPDRPNVPTRSSTVGSPQELDRDRHVDDSTIYQSRSDDLNHSGISLPDNDMTISGPSPAFLSPSRPTTPGSSHNHQSMSNSGHSEESHTTHSSLYSASSNGAFGPAQTSTTSTSTSITSTPCSACGKPMMGAFVRALGTVYHLNCFKCMDCGTVVASKFFPIDGPDNKQFPLCERDYFRRLNLICAKCGMALRGSYITACSTAILKQFVEINRNMRDECWHPECYMINKFWNVKVVSRRASVTPSSSDTAVQEAPWVDEEKRETPTSLKDKQVRMEQQVYRIWTVLSAFEESSAACISDMLRQVSNGQYQDAIRMAEKFILHVEVLFATIDDLEFVFASLNVKGMSHVREARMLCRKTVDLLKLLSHTQETGARRMGMTQELLALVTGLAHYLKILIRIALTGALKLERDYNTQEAMTSFLDKLHLLAVQGGNPTAKRMIKGAHGEYITPTKDSNFGTQGVTYGFRSLAPENAGESPFSAASNKMASPPSDLCVRCNLTVEEDCVRLGTYQRWHSHCIQCQTCGKVAAVPAKESTTPKTDDKDKDKDGPKLSTARRPPANVSLFVFDPSSMQESPSFGEVPTVVFCTEHGHSGCRGGFQPVSRLEQYSFLLNVALRRLYILLKKLGVVPSSPVGPLDMNMQPQVLKPPFARSNTEVMIVDDSAPNSPATGPDDGVPTQDDGITLADIPQLVEAAQAREQHRSLPRQNSIPYIAELSALELAIVKHAAVLALTKSPLRDQFDLDEILELIEMKKGGFWNKLFKGDNKKNLKKKGVFGVPLELLVEREGSDSLLGASRATLRVPSFIDDVVSAMRQMDMSIEGIFRKNGNIRRLKELTEAIDRDPSSVDLSTDNPVQLAALLKKFLRDLPEPLMTFKLHRLLIASQSVPNDADRKRLLHLVCVLLPKYHRDTMEVLFVFLKWVASFAHLDEETGSKMDLQNLATVICPSILYSRGRDAVRDESFGAIRVVTSLLENQDEFFTVPEELLLILHDQELFSNSMDLPSRDFMKKCDTYMRLKSGARTPGLTSPTITASPFFSGSSSGNINNMARGGDGTDSRSHTPRQPYMNQQGLDRPPMGNTALSENFIRNGPPRMREQSPPALIHQPQSYPQPAGTPPSLSQGMASIQAPQPRNPIGQPSDLEWVSPRPPPIPGQMPTSSSPRPRPTSFAGRPSGEHPHPFQSSNGHSPAVQLRQRT